MLVSRFLCLNINANMYQNMAQVGESQLRLLSFHPRTNGTIHKVALEEEELSDRRYASAKHSRFRPYYLRFHRTHLR